MTGTGLPEGWTLQRVREVSGDQEAVVLDTDRAVTYSGWHGAEHVLRPEFILGFGDLCVVRAVDDDDWHMGTLNGDGTVLCWSTYDDFGNALRGL